MVPGLRWNLRGNAYACFMTERYPPFVWGSGGLFPAWETAALGR
jgi:hypothetical protein